MRIAVVQHIHSGDYAAYLSALINEQAKHNEYQIKTWSNSVPVSQQFISEDSVVYILIEGNAQLSIKWWYSFKLPSILKKLRADVVLDLNGIASDRIRIPQAIALSQELFSDEKKLQGTRKFAAMQMNRSISLTQNVVVYSESRAENLSAAENVRQKVVSIPFTAPLVFRAFEWHEKIMIKAQQADNKDYFISVLEDDSEENFILLMRAFSKFKKWQQSSMQLLVLPKYDSFAENILQKFKTYKYRDEVRLLEDLEESQLAPILASAYALVHLSTQPDLMVLVTAFKCSLPVIAYKHNDIGEVAGDAVLYASEKNFEAIGGCLIELYKDENLHSRLKDAAKEKAMLPKPRRMRNEIMEAYTNCGTFLAACKFQSLIMKYGKINDNYKS